MAIRKLVREEKEVPAHMDVCMAGLNNIAIFMRSIPDGVITSMKQQTRKDITKFLIEQVTRFKGQGPKKFKRRMNNARD